MRAHLPSHLGGVKIKGPGVSQAQHEILMAAQSGALAMASDSLRGHDVLGDDDQRETEVGFIAAVSLALSAARAAEVRPHLIGAGFDTVRALTRATMDDLMRARDAPEAALRGCGLSVGVARALVSEMAVVYATFYVEAGLMNFSDSVD